MFSHHQAIQIKAGDLLTDQWTLLDEFLKVCQRSAINWIAVCVDAGLGDVGYASRWTCEIYNHTLRIVELRAGWRIAQMKFHRVEGVDTSYEQKGGSYGLGKWKPEDMLPRGNME